MKELMTRHGIFSVLADRLLEMGETGLAAFFRQVAERDDNVFNPDSPIPNRGHAAKMMDYIEEGKWTHAASQFAALEMIAQGIDPADADRYNKAALETHGDILEDGVIELDDHPRILMPPDRDDVWVSGWFVLGDEARRHARRRRANANPNDEYAIDDEVEYDPPPRWGQMDHDQQMRLLQTLTGFDESSITITNGEIWGRPAHNYGFTGMKISGGQLSDVLAEAVRIGYIREG